MRSGLFGTAKKAREAAGKSFVRGPATRGVALRVRHVRCSSELVSGLDRLVSRSRAGDMKLGLQARQEALHVGRKPSKRADRNGGVT